MLTFHKSLFPLQIFRTVTASLAILILLIASVRLRSVAAAEPQSELAKQLSGVKLQQYASAPGYSEGPTWTKGEVLFCSGALLRVNQAGEVHEHVSIKPAGTFLLKSGDLLICDNQYKALLSLSPAGKVSVIVEQFEHGNLRSLNDLTVDARGNVYWTDPAGSSPESPTGKVFRVRPDGRVDLLTSGLAFPNGIEVDPASKFLYVIESQTKKILRYALPSDNDLLGEAELFYDLEGSGGDGCAFDAEGNLWVADFHRPDTGKGRITVLSPKAEVLAHLPVPAKLVSNITFGGVNHDEIFCTTGDPPGVFHAQVGVQGFAGHPGKALPSIRELDLVVRKTHPDSSLLQKIAGTAEAAKISGGKFPQTVSEELKSQIATLSDAKVRADMQQLLPQLEVAAVRYAEDAVLLAEIKRLKGEATLSVQAPDWLRAYAGDQALGVFRRITEIDLNERTDGHKKAEAKPLSERTNNETLKLLKGQDELISLQLSGTAVTSPGLVHLRDLTAMQKLNLCLTQVDDSGFEHLAGMVNMKRMTICASKITGTGFKHLGGMKQIESINLHSAPVSDEGLESISKLTSLKRLEVVHTHITDAGLAHLANLVNLRRLHFHGPETTATGGLFVDKLTNLYELDIYDKPASNEALAKVANLPNLRFLRFIIGKFDDEGVKHLAHLTTLEKLVLNSPEVTDASVAHLAGLQNLRELTLSGTKITEAGKARLKEHLPKVKIQ